MPKLSALIASAGVFVVSTVFVCGDGGNAGATLDVQFMPDSGRASCRLVCPDGQAWAVVEVGPMLLDQAPQQVFSPARWSDHAWDNGSVAVEFEEISPRSHAINWQTRDGSERAFQLPILDNSDYYGCGERFHALNQKGYILPMASIDRPEAKGVVSYKPVPFYISTRGYGIWVDSFAPGTFDLNATDRERCILDYRERRLRVVIIAGPEPAAILEEFTRLTGRPPVPPPWSFAPWKSRDVHRSRAEVLQDAEWTRRHDLPGSVIVFDSPWETGYNNFVLNERQFTDPAAMFARLNELGFHACVWLTPFVNTRNVQDMPGIAPGPSSNYAEAERNGYLVLRADGTPMTALWWKGEGGLVDFTRPASVEWWHEQVRRTRAWGVRAFKCDDGEGNFVADAVFDDGTPAAWMKNRYAALYNRAMHEFIGRELGGDGVLLGRSGFTGSQRHPFCWAGDNEANFSPDNGLPSVLIAGQTAALSGFALWGHDIAGYIGRPSKEVFIRWTQFGALSPLMMVHMTSNLGPWDFDDEALAIYRKYAKLHTQLFPYIYQAAHEASRTGMPIIRPMVLAFPHDPIAADHPDQYLFGPDLLVAPMVHGGTQRNVYLPDGRWVEYETGRTLLGGRTVEVDAPLASMPLFVRAGAMIEMLPPDVDTLLTRHEGLAGDVVPLDERRVLQIWPEGEGSLTSWDGLEAVLHRDAAGPKLRLSSRERRPVEVRWMHRGVSAVTVDGAAAAVGRDADGIATVLQLTLSERPTTVTWSWRSDAAPPSPP